MNEMAARPSAVVPFQDPSRRSRLVKVGGWLVGIALVVVVLNLLGVDVVGWLQDLWDAQQLITTAWNVLFATVLVVSAFGWKGGKQLVTQSYADAKIKVANQKAQHAEKKAAKRAERAESGRGLFHRHDDGGAAEDASASADQGGDQ